MLKKIETSCLASPITLQFLTEGTVTKRWCPERERIIDWVGKFDGEATEAHLVMRMVECGQGLVRGEKGCDLDDVWRELSITSGGN